MNISYDGTTVSLKTEQEEVFLAEKSGTKPNTVRVVDNDEYRMLNAHTPKKISIQYQKEIFLRTLTNLHFSFLFDQVIVILSWKHEKHYPLLSDENQPDSKDELSPILLPRSLIIDLDRHRRDRSHADFITYLLEEHLASAETAIYPLWVPDIYISLSTLKKLDLYRGEKTYDEAFSNLLNHYTKHHTIPRDCDDCEHLKACKKEGEPGKSDERFITVDISKSMHDAIQKVGHGRSANSVIREFHEAYLVKRAEERGPLHD